MRNNASVMIMVRLTTLPVVVVAATFFLVPDAALAFFVPQHQHQHRVLSRSSCTVLRPPSSFVRLHQTNAHDDASSPRERDDDGSSTSSSSSTPSAVSRRRVFAEGSGAMIAAATVAMTSSSSLLPLASYAAEGGIGSSPESPVAVIGAGGKVGKLCTKILADKGLYVRAITLSGRQVLDQESSFVSYAAGDVTDYVATKSALAGASGAIFAASANGKGKRGDPAHVDYLGSYNTAKACLENGVQKLVLISAGTATRPDSAGFKATNFFVKYVYGEKIMDYKIAGEAVTRDMYAEYNDGKNDDKKLGYAVIRPGGLNEKPSVGSAKVHVSQGDVYSSEVTREDVALVTVAALTKGASTDMVTFELNQVEGLGKAMQSLPTLPDALVHAGAPTYDALLNNLVTDDDMRKNYPDLMNDFRGNQIETVEQLA